VLTAGRAPLQHTPQIARHVFPAVPRPDCYDQHRARWEATEDVIELAAMLDCHPPVAVLPLPAPPAWRVWRRRGLWAVGWLLYWVAGTWLLLAVFR
jgi:hypothetical protein